VTRGKNINFEYLWVLLMSIILWRHIYFINGVHNVSFGCILYCVCFNLCKVWVCVCVGFVMCGCFGNMCASIYFVLCLYCVFWYGFVYLYLFLFVLSVLGLLSPSGNSIAFVNNNNNKS
jgi:hypothetical protein